MPRQSPGMKFLITLWQSGEIRVGVDPKFETLRNRDNCSERRFGWQQPVFSRWSSELR
jgi:hypothetical protein